MEDIILVQIGHALGHRDFDLTDRLVHAGIVGSIVTGTIAGAIGTLLGWFPRTLRALTNPGAAHDQMLYAGCDLLDQSDAFSAIRSIRPYWMLKSWAMMGQQMGMVMSGFFYGSGALQGKFFCTKRTTPTHFHLEDFPAGTKNLIRKPYLSPCSSLLYFPLCTAYSS